MAAISEQEEDQVNKANASGLAPVVFVHGLWLLASSWDRWRTVFEEAGYATVAPDWPDDAANVDEAKSLYDEFAVPGSGETVFQAAAANLNPWTEANVDTRNPDRGPLLIISGERDHTVPWAVANASYKLEKHNPGVTEIVARRRELLARGGDLLIAARNPYVCNILKAAGGAELALFRSVEEATSAVAAPVARVRAMRK